jgi:drug/metabolite transporter (DMT)-like permease
MAAESQHFRACSSHCRPLWMTSEMFNSFFSVFLLGGLYIVTSACMVAFNKYLMNQERFPFAVPLVLIHAGFSSVCTLMMFLIKPSLFPSLTSATEKVSIDRDLILRGALPIALLFSVQLMLTNTAYLHSSMAFLQMMKEANLVLVYAFSLLVAMEVFCWDKLKIILMILIATTMTIHGELQFSWTGFALQGTGQLFESSKIVLQAMLLSNTGRKLDVLTYVLIVMPLCFCMLGSFLLMLLYIAPSEHLQTPQWSDIVSWWPILAANAFLAFGLNVAIAFFMKQSSAVGFILAGIVKDAAIVLFGVFALHEPISPIQFFAFAAQLVLIWIWSLMKIFPEKFEKGVLTGIFMLLSPAVDDRSLLSAEPKETRYGTDDRREEKSQC